MKRKPEKHGMSRTPEYSAWRHMLHRCYAPQCKEYRNYGGRGITVCDRWKESFSNFYHDMGPRTSPKHSLDRLYNDGNYEPSNCAWRTSKEQGNNRRTCITVILPSGEEVSPETASKILNIKKATLFSRLRQNTPLDAKVLEHNREHFYKDGYYTCKQLSDIKGVPAKLISSRIASGMPVEKATEMPIQSTDTYLYKGEYLTVGEIAEKTDIKAYTLLFHIRKGLSAEEVVNYIKYGNPTTKAMESKTRKLYEYKGQLYTVYGLTRICDIPSNVLADRLHSGMPVEKAVETPIREVNLYKFKDSYVSIPELVGITGIPRTSLRREIVVKGYTADEAVDLIYKRMNCKKF